MNEELIGLRFDIRWDVNGQGEPRVVVFKPGTMTPGETMPLSEAVRRGIVSTEQAEHALEVNHRIRKAAERAQQT